MATDYIVGIDLGTTNSLVAYMQGDTPVVIPGEDGLNLVPSVVALTLDENDKNQVIVGNAARKYLIETLERAVYSIKRLMGRGVEDIQDELKLTLAQAHSMGDVVAAKALPWVTTPDDAMAWGVAFGLDDEIGVVLSRSLAAAEAPVEQDADGKLRAVPLKVWQPSWYSTGNFSGGSHSGGSVSSGLFSAAAIPDFSSMVSAIGSINHPEIGRAHV
jgi:molecular chaperone DnaK (HSP70)